MEGKGCDSCQAVATPNGTVNGDCFALLLIGCNWGMTLIAFVGASVPLMADIPVCRTREKRQQSYRG
jgi:hypothetical protein